MVEVHSMKGDEVIEAQFQVFWNSSLDGLKWSDLGKASLN